VNKGFGFASTTTELSVETILSAYSPAFPETEI
jgi:hypothetical protein